MVQLLLASVVWHLFEYGRWESWSEGRGKAMSDTKIIKPTALIMTIWASELDILRKMRGRLKALHVLAPSEDLQAEIDLLDSLEWRTAASVKLEDMLGEEKQEGAVF